MKNKKINISQHAEVIAKLIREGKTVSLALTFILIIGIVGAVEDEHEEIFAQTEPIIQQRIPCSELTNDQLEVLGDYFMEQMHPGGLHEIMDERMGGEGSASLRQVHINMGLTFYCGQKRAMSAGMVNTMMGRAGMMGNYGMMNNPQRNAYNSQNYVNFAGPWLTGLIFVILIMLILIIVLLIKKLQKR